MRMRRSSCRASVLLAVALGALSLFVLPAQAATTIDITDCDHFVGQAGLLGLADALAAYTSGDTLRFASGGSLGTAHTVPVTTQIALSKDVTIDGGGYAVTLDGSAVAPVPDFGGIISISNGFPVTVTLNRLTLANGRAAEYGGALLVDINATVNLTNATLAGNSIFGPSGNEAGAIEVNGGMLNATDCTFVNNRVVAAEIGDGGAITFRNGPGTVASRITNCTFTDNQVIGAISEGGAIAAIEGAAFPIITNSLFVRNQASSGPNVIGTLDATSDHNLTDNASGNPGTFTHPHDVVTTTPGVGSLGNNGGTTQTVPLQTGSPAIDAGNDAVCALAPPPATPPNGAGGIDQRGVPRTGQGTHCDIGAFEVQTTPIPTVTNLTGPPTALVGQLVTFSGAAALDPGNPPGTTPLPPVGSLSVTVTDTTTGTAQAATLTAVAGGSVTFTASFTFTTPGPHALQEDFTVAPGPILYGPSRSAMSVTVSAYSLVVNTTAPDSAANVANCLLGNGSTCRLRDAIEVVNQRLTTASPTPTITFALPAGPQTITLANGTLSLSRDMAITGPGANLLAIDGANSATIFHATGSATIAFRA